MCRRKPTAGKMNWECGNINTLRLESLMSHATLILSQRLTFKYSCDCSAERRFNLVLSRRLTATLQDLTGRRRKWKEGAPYDVYKLKGHYRKKVKLWINQCCHEVFLYINTNIWITWNTITYVNLHWVALWNRDLNFG